MDPVRQAIAAKLLSDPAVTGKLAASNAVYQRRAPVNAPHPLIIIHRQAETDEDYTFDGKGLERDLWVVKAVASSATSSAPDTQAESIAAAIQASLHFADLTVTGYGVVKPTRRLKVDYGEPDGAEQFVHLGGMYALELIQP